jgi:hypothetical protein
MIFLGIVEKVKNAMGQFLLFILLIVLYAYLATLTFAMLLIKTLFFWEEATEKDMDMPHAHNRRFT